MATDTRPTALVTGASAGFGEQFARQLAGRDWNVVVVARSADRLDTLAGELHDTHGVDVEVLPADLTDREQLGAVEARLSADPPVSLLVNNAGFGTIGRFVDLPVDREDDEVRLNCLAAVRLCHAAAPAMVERGVGAILNVSSMAGFQPTPGMAIYGATKAFLTSFSEALHEELGGTGVHVMALCPGFSHTGFQERAEVTGEGVPEFMWMEPADIVQAALRDLDRKRAVSVPGLLNRVTAGLTEVLPNAVTRRAARVLMGRSR